MKTGNRLALAVMILGGLVMVYPYAYMVGSSMKTRKEFAEVRRSLIPPRYQIGELLAHARGEPSALDWPGADWPVWRNYVDAIRYGGIDRYLGNSFIYAVVITSVQLFFNILAAYAFARMRFFGRDLLFGMLLGTMMIRQIAKQVSDLHDWHDQKDSDGVYVWYVRQSLEKAIVKLADNIEQQTMLLRQFIYERKKGS